MVNLRQTESLQGQRQFPLSVSPGTIALLDTTGNLKLITIQQPRMALQLNAKLSQNLPSLIILGHLRLVSICVILGHFEAHVG